MAYRVCNTFTVRCDASAMQLQCKVGFAALDYESLEHELYYPREHDLVLHYALEHDLRLWGTNLTRAIVGAVGNHSRRGFVLNPLGCP